MMYSRKELADSIIKFISNDLLTGIDDPHLKFSLCMAKKALHENPDILENFLESPIIASVITEKDERYDVELFARTMKNVLGEYDSYYIMIPRIPMFSPENNKVKITSEDVDKILSYLSLVTEKADIISQ